MFRVSKMSSKVFAVDIGDRIESDFFFNEAETINELVLTGVPVILCEELEEAANLFDISVKDIEVVD
jgi:hypothetical protein